MIYHLPVLQSYLKDLPWVFYDKCTSQTAKSAQKCFFCFAKPYIRALYNINLSFKIIERPIFLLVFNRNIHQE